jgi:hypothetical protein
VCQFGTDVIVGDTVALASGTASKDGQYQTYLGNLQHLGASRDNVAAGIKQALFDAEFNNRAPGGDQLSSCNMVLQQADSVG